MSDDERTEHEIRQRVAAIALAVDSVSMVELERLVSDDVWSELYGEALIHFDEAESQVVITASGTQWMREALRGEGDDA